MAQEGTGETIQPILLGATGAEEREWSVVMVRRLRRVSLCPYPIQFHAISEEEEEEEEGDEEPTTAAVEVSITIQSLTI